MSDKIMVHVLFKCFSYESDVILEVFGNEETAFTSCHILNKYNADSMTAYRTESYEVSMEQAKAGDYNRK